MVDKAHTEREKRLLTLIDTLNLSQKSFAEKIGVTNRALYNYLYEDRCPSPECLVKMHHLFKVNLNWLLTGLGPIFINNGVEINLSRKEEKLLFYFNLLPEFIQNGIIVGLDKTELNQQFFDKIKKDI